MAYCPSCGFDGFVGRCGRCGYTQTILPIESTKKTMRKYTLNSSHVLSEESLVLKDIAHSQGVACFALPQRNLVVESLKL